MGSKSQKNAGFLIPAELTGYALTCVKFMIPDALEYRAAARGLIQMLAEWHQWEKSYQPGDTRARDVARIFRELLGETLTIGADCDECDGDCTEYSPRAPFIEYAPNDPFLTPDEVPAQYLFPPFYIAPALNLLGASAGDVVTDLAHSPVGFPVVAGYPRFRVHLDGAGIARLHLVPTITGGYAQVQVDGDVLSLVYVDTERDVLAVPPETYNESIFEYEFTTPGAHFIDVSFIPKLNDSLTPPITFGGGLRKVVLCGFNIMPIIPTWQFTEACEFQYSNDGGATWTTVPGWMEWALDCFKGDPGDPGTPGEPGEPGEPGTPGTPGADGAGYDWPGTMPDPAAAATTCAVGDAIAKKMLSDFYGYANGLFDMFFTRAKSEKDVMDTTTQAMGMGIVGVGASLWYTSVLGLMASGAVIGGLGTGGIYAGIAALINGNAALDWLTIRNDSQRYSVENEVACIIDDLLGDSTAINAAKWSAIRAGLADMTKGGAAFRSEFLQYVNTLFPLAAARGAALGYNPAFDCFCDDIYCPDGTLQAAARNLDFVGGASGAEITIDNSARGNILNLFDVANPEYAVQNLPNTAGRISGTQAYYAPGTRGADIAVSIKILFPEGERCVKRVDMQTESAGTGFTYLRSAIIAIRADGRQVLLPITNASLPLGRWRYHTDDGINVIGFRFYFSTKYNTATGTADNRRINGIYINVGV